ncbi:MAG TPA: riboflavin biosynthesis protein RibF [Anaeromyxobacteraceae bacterium]|jgi:riboflavin kinase/FMN adenylyltransferase
MELFRSIAEARSLAGCAVAVGNFDGVHLGHRALFARARTEAAPRGGKAVALTFHPHPVRVLRPGLLPPCLTPLARKLELFAACGLDAAVVQPFDAAYARSSAEEFVARDLAGHLGAAAVVVGPDFTAGHGRTRVEGLRPLLEARGARLSVVDPVTSDGLVVSSTKIRELLLEGRVEAAAELLGREHDIDGAAVRGAGRGRGIGFATANLMTEAMLPARGVYAVRAWLGERAASGPFEGVCNIGVKPTVQETGPEVAEVHLLDHAGTDLYGELLRVAFVARLREERRFASVDDLRAQIARDAATARARLGRAG